MHDRDAEHSQTSIGYYAYRSGSREGRTSRDAFPFITWDTSDDGRETTISFMWRLWRYERRDETRGGYVLFVPWGSM